MALFRPYERTDSTKKSGGDPTSPAATKVKSAPAPSVTPEVKSTPIGITKQAAPAAESSASTPSQPTRRSYTPKKDRPTPTREQAEAARQERINPTLSAKERKQRAREVARQNRVEAFARQEDEPTKVLLRDYIDQRWTATEFMIPVMLLLLAANIAFMRNYLLTQIISVAVLVVFAIWITNVTIVWRGFKKLARQRITAPKFTGLLMYANSRMMTIRRFRRPGPRIERGAEI